MKGRALFCLHYHSISSDSEHKMEGELLKFLQQIKDDGGSASLTLTTRGGKVKAKLEVELEPPAPANPGSTSPSPATAPAPGGGRRRRKGAAAKAKAGARAALDQTTHAAATQPPSYIRRCQCSTGSPSISSAISSPPAPSSPPPSLPFALIRASQSHVCGEAANAILW